MTEMSTEEVVKEYTEDGDHEKFSHYVTKEDLEAAWFTGKPCKALCGKMWLPTRDPQKFPICPECKELFEQYEDDLSE